MAGADARESVDGAPDDEATALAALRVTREESRVVLDHQVALLNEIENRTMRTVRLAGVMLGLVLSVVGVLGPSALASVRPIALVPAGLGVCCLVGCVLFGIGTYSTSNANYGIDDSFRADVVAGTYGEREWLYDLLAGYDEWTWQMQRVAERNGVYLLVAQSFLLIGFSLLMVAITLSVITTHL